MRRLLAQWREVRREYREIKSLGDDLRDIADALVITAYALLLGNVLGAGVHNLLKGLIDG